MIFDSLCSLAPDTVEKTEIAYKSSNSELNWTETAVRKKQPKKSYIQL